MRGTFLFVRNAQAGHKQTRPVWEAYSFMVQLNRGFILAAAAVTGGATGALQMWSIFNRPLVETYGWSVQEVSLAFSIMVLVACCSGFLAGWLQNRIQPSAQILAGGMLFGLGWALAGFVDSIPMLYLTFGVIGGIGNGLIYNTAIALAVKWYPDKRGLANGLVVGGSGLAPVVFAPYGNFLIESMGVADAFKVVGLTLVVIYLAFFWALRWPERDMASEEKVRNTRWLRREGREYRTSEMLRSGRFWFMWLILTCAATSGTMMIGHAASIGQDLAGISAADAAGLVGLMAVASFAGRMGFGTLSDHTGRYIALIGMMLVTCVDMLFFFGNARDYVSFAISLCGISACYGGTMAVLPSLCGDTFGKRNFGSNYACLFTAYTAASFVGPQLAAHFVATTGTYDMAFAVAGTLSLLAALLCGFARMLQSRALNRAAAVALP